MTTTQTRVSQDATHRSQVGTPAFASPSSLPLSVLGLSLVAAFAAMAPRYAAAADFVPGNLLTGYTNNAETGNITILSGITVGSGSGAGLGLRNNVSMGTLLNQGLLRNGPANGDYALDNNNNSSIVRLQNEGTIRAKTAVFNAGGSSIGTLTNSGTIAGTPGGGTKGIVNTGSIGTLNNSGQITVQDAGVYNTPTGSLGALTNSGTIEAMNYAVLNYGTLSEINNTGLLSATQGVGVQNISSVGTLSNSGTISGTLGVEVAITGTLQALNNSALIQGSSDAVLVGSAASLGALTNSGTLLGGSTSGLSVQGTLGTLNNSGLIHTTGARVIDVGATGTLGPITNSGTIAGDIRNQSSRGLTLNGGTGSTFGTLTGAAGAIGSIHIPRPT